MPVESLSRSKDVSKKIDLYTSANNLLLCTFLLVLMQYAYFVSEPFWAGLTEAEGITTPFGPLYLIEEPSDWLREHEACHFERLQEIGSIAFYSDYIWGGACTEEIRCGSNPHTHAACTTYPLRNEPR